MSAASGSDRSVQRAVVARVIRAYREARGVSRTELAQRLDRGLSYVEALESGRRTPDLIELRTLCRALGSTLEDLITRLEEELGE